MRAMLRSWIVKMAVLQELMHKFCAIAVKIPMHFSAEIDNKKCLFSLVNFFKSNLK